MIEKQDADREPQSRTRGDFTIASDGQTYISPDDGLSGTVDIDDWFTAVFRVDFLRFAKFSFLRAVPPFRSNKAQ